VKHASPSLSAYLDGELSSEERARFEAHLERCPDCRAERDRLKGALSLLSRLPPSPPPSPNFEQHFYARLAAERPAPRARLFDRPLWRWLAPGLAGVAASVALVLVVEIRHRPPPDDLLVGDLDLFENYEAVASVGVVENQEDVEVVAHLDELGVRK